MRISTPLREPKPPVPALRAGPAELLSPLTFSIAAVALVAIVFLTYSPSLNFRFILDDHRFIGDPRMQSPGHVWEYFTTWVWAQFAGGPMSFYRPLFLLWLRVNFILSEMSPWGWHLLSIGKHVSVAILLGLLVWKLLRDRVAVLIAGALFALHPAQTESVAWITVPDPLMAAGVLASALLYLRYRDDPHVVGRPHDHKAGRKSRKVNRAEVLARPSVAWLVASAGACFAALLAKETAIVLPIVLFAMMLTTQKGEWRSARLAQAFRKILPFLTVTAVYFLLRLNALGGRLTALTQHLAWSTVLLSWPATLWFYVKVLLWPVRPRAFADPTQTDAFSVRGVLLPALAVCCALALLAGALLWAWRRTRDLPDQQAARVRCALFLGTLVLVLPILPALNLNALNPGDSLHGRYAYLSSTGMALLLATGWHLAGKRRALLLFAAGGLTVAFTVFTVQQEAAWKDDLAVFTVAQQSAPHNSFVALNLARAHVQRALLDWVPGRCNEALPVFEQVTRQYPQDWFAWAGLGECFYHLNDLPKAEQSLRRAAELSHEPRVTEQWQQLRAKMETLNSAPAK